MKLNELLSKVKSAKNVVACFPNIREMKIDKIQKLIAIFGFFAIIVAMSAINIGKKTDRCMPKATKNKEKAGTSSSLPATDASRK